MVVDFKIPTKPKPQNAKTPEKPDTSSDECNDTSEVDDDLTDKSNQNYLKSIDSTSSSEFNISEVDESNGSVKNSAGNHPSGPSVHKI